jgi:glucose dehydrogenase
MSRARWEFVAVLGLLCLAPVRQSSNAPYANHDWPVYGGNSENQHFSPLASINRENVSQLREAWRYDTHEEGGLETSPLIVRETL